jgi:capsular exopolysaccharide synthesis family protein
MPIFRPEVRAPLLPGPAYTPHSPVPSGARGDPPPAADRIALGAVLAALRRRKGIMLGAATLGVAAAAYFTYVELPMYRATAVVQTADTRRALTTGIEQPEKDNAPMFNPVTAQIQLLRSRGLIGRVVDAEGLRLRPDYRGFAAPLLADVHLDPAASADTLQLSFLANGVRMRGRAGIGAARYGAPVQLGGVRFVILARPRAREGVWYVVSRERAIDDVLESLVVYPRVFTNVVDVSYTAPRPTLAQRVVNDLVQSFVAISIDAAREQSRRRRVFLAEQLRQTDSIEARAQLALDKFRQRAQIFSSQEKLAARQRDLMTLDERKVDLDATRRMYESLLAALEGQNGSAQAKGLRPLLASPELAASPVVVQLAHQLALYETRLDSMTTGAWRSSASDPDVQQLTGLIASTRGNLIDAVRGYLTSLDARAGALAGVRAQSAASLAVLPGLAAEEERLTEQVETMRRMGDYLRAEHQKARVAEAVEAGRVEIMDLAAKPYAPVASLRPLKLGVGLFAGLLVGSLAAFLVEFRDTSIRRREELEALLHLPSLGVVPKTTAWRVGPRRFASFWPHRDDNGTAAADGGPESLITLSDQPSLGREAYRALRANLLFSCIGERIKTVAVTSAVPGEGKTLTAANLAVTVAREGASVLLVDCDLRRGQLHRLFRVPSAPGLSDLLAPHSVGTLAPAAKPGLSLLPRGTASSSEITRLTEPAMRDVLRALEDRFDFIILDTPPVLAVADAVVLSALADAVLLVVRAGSSDRETVRQALGKLALVGAPVVGTVFNGVATEMLGNAQYYAAYTAVT